MKFLLDHDVFAATARFLAGLQHDVVPVAQIGHSRSKDSELLKLAHVQERIFVTRDRDFGGLVFIESFEAGVIYLRMLPSTQNAVHQELGRVLTAYTEKELMKAFIVIEPGRHRFRKLVN